MTPVDDGLIRAFLAEGARRAVAAAPSFDEAVAGLAPRIGGRPSGASQRLIVILAATLLLVAALGSAIAAGSGIFRLPLVIDSPAVSPFEGFWVSTSDSDGGTQTMTVRRSAEDAIEIVIYDDVATVCSLTPSMMTGTGRVDGDALVIPAPDYRCDNGSAPRTTSGPPLEEQLRNLTFIRDAETEQLTDNLGGVWFRQSVAAESPTPRPSQEVAPPNEAEVNALINAFLDARIAGEGAEKYLHSLYPEIPSEDIPLLYATSSGAPYERAEFEPLGGVDWPYGFMGYKVRLFAGDTVVEQLFFMPHHDPEYFPADGRLGLEYQPYGFATHIPPTTENGQPVPVPEDYFDGEVTLSAAHPWVSGRLIPEGPGVGPTTDGGQRSDWDELLLMADPAPVEVEGGCRTGSPPADAQALAESIQSYPLEASAPVAVSAGGAHGVMMDVQIWAGAIICAPANRGGDLLPGVLNPVFDDHAPAMVDNGLITGVATGEWMRLYLFDAPEWSSMRVVAIAIVAPESRFERAVDAAAPVIDSLEFHNP